MSSRRADAKRRPSRTSGGSPEIYSARPGFAGLPRQTNSLSAATTGPATQGGETLMAEKPPGTEPTQRAPGGQDTLVRIPRHKRWTLLAAFPAGGGCVAFGLGLT